MTTPLTWDPQTHQNAQAIVDNWRALGEGARQALARIFAKHVGTLECPPPEDDPDGRYVVVFDSDYMPAIRKRA